LGQTGSKGSAVLLNSSADIPLINRVDLVGVTMKFISENPLSHSDEEMGRVPKELFNGNFSGNFLSVRYSQNPNHLSFIYSKAIGQISDYFLTEY
jgi:hypothetical protein